MSKVNCLRKIISKLTDGEIPDSELDTVCKCLDKIAEVVSAGVGGIHGPPGKDGTKWFVVDQNLMSGSNAPTGAKARDLVLDNQGDVFEVYEDLLLTNTGVNLKGS